MHLQNATKNQHFIPQVEQRLNAINPLAKEENQKIYSFSLESRESHAIKIVSHNGVKISKTLSLNDIFSFDVIDSEVERYNLEELFHQYESKIKHNTENLITKLPAIGSDVKYEIVNIFIYKFINFVRNPYSIKKVLNTFPQLRNVHPSDPIHYKNFERIINGRKPQQKHICNQLGITEEEYADWLSIIYLLLTPLEKSQPNFLEKVIRDLYGDPNLFIMVFIYTYDDKTCLLSDRGYSIPTPENDHMAWDFNLNSNSFIRYGFGNIDSLSQSILCKELIESFKNRPKSIEAYHIKNDLNELEKYNKNVVYQCKNNVFNSSTECYGL